ncbi:MAG TPA: carbamoyl-phosphate synthase large subunit [Verrucomicrobia subdivision 3 bacterium]|nr:carbamoyl-phosphate synthase large subunit [Limisphaerales bacterium]
MPKRTDIHSVLIIGAGPIIIGQACEFDYSGTQACKALREEGYRVVLINSNPATIMTDPEFADRTYIEPITPECVEKIIVRELEEMKKMGVPVDSGVAASRQSAANSLENQRRSAETPLQVPYKLVLLPTLGGQTALNTAMSLHRSGVLEKHGVEMIGAKAEAIQKGEDRQIFKDLMLSIGLDVPISGTAHNMDEARAVADKIGRFPLIIRPAFTLGGTGGGIGYNQEEFEAIAKGGIELSPVNEILIEESLLGWKEYEMEVMRDKADNCVIICSIENFDPMGVHTGDSITVAPIQTLTDKEFQIMRDQSFAVIRAVGVETGGSNIQFGVSPENGRMVIIEMNPRVSRSSALASKATGFPIAKIAAKLAVGYLLDELKNDITRETPASFEPSIDYVVTKIPRFAFEKFPQADPTLTTQMKSVGEAMAIGRTFKESLQKCLRSLEIGRSGLGGDGKPWRIGTEVYGDRDILPRDVISRKLSVPNAERIFFIRHALRAGFTIEEIFQLTKIDRWFLVQIKEIVDFEEELATAKN